MPTNAIVDSSKRIERCLSTVTRDMPVDIHRELVVAMSNMWHEINASGAHVQRSVCKSLLCSGIVAKGILDSLRHGGHESRADDVGVTVALLYVVLCKACALRDPGDVQGGDLCSDLGLHSMAAALDSSTALDFEVVARRQQHGTLSEADATIQYETLPKEDAVLFFHVFQRDALWHALERKAGCERTVPLACVGGLFDRQLDMSDAVYGNLSSIVGAAESEAGQQVLRDLILSSRLPADVVRSRTHILLSRDMSQVAAKEHAQLVADAHDVAMRGALYAWQQDGDELHRACALLAGLQMVMLKKAPDIKTEAAFYGRVQLPYLATMRKRDAKPRIFVHPETNTWTVYSLRVDSGPEVLLSATGAEGMQRCVALFLQTARGAI